MTASTTHCWKKRQPFDRLWARVVQHLRLYVLVALGLLSAGGVWADTPVDLQGLKVERVDGAVTVSANLHFDLPLPLEEALLKGVSLYFVTEVDISRERWYFYDKRVAHAERHVRLFYMPLTRRWRVNVSPRPFNAGGLGMSLAQSYDTVDEAMSAVRRIAQWPVAQVSDVDMDAKQNISVSFKLDLSQLPRPLQIGAAGQSEWNLNLNKSMRLVLEPGR
ncbi:DUF4390 domain-containing protein [Limnohabitans sp. TS-CS-82]|jgi:hypothetical protein|uniref:DUF4390 domain-containing protein n=1 Tax=Limnohabitans sp. TS-CS-82 TaxID=2094193 RepID=UPI000CF26FA7|nr:DUF4390 domain-containing protein [Limnohabitans sp. TS-CS-82]PQA80076.1 DUF4390 domain-containing protein [Limnohabitans sp. TS-CS-82]